MRPLPARAPVLLVLATLLVTAPLAAVAAPRPDLRAAAFSGPGTVAAGGSLSVPVTVTSTAAATKTRTVLVLSEDTRRDASDVVLNGRGSATRLTSAKGAFRAKVTLRGAIPVGTRPGSYRLLACVDAGGAVKETKEQNNCRAAKAGTVVPAPTPPPAPAPLDTTAPAAPSIGTITPASPSNNPSPDVRLTGEGGARVDVFRQAACAGPIVTSLTLPGSGTAALPVPMNLNTTTTLTARAVDAAGNVSACSASRDYVHDDIAPAPPTVGASTPFIGGTSSGGTYRGTAPAGVTVRGWESTSCSGSDVPVTASAAVFASSGLYVETGPFREVGFDTVDAAGNTSACVAPPPGGTYVTAFNGTVVTNEAAGDNSTRALAQTPGFFDERGNASTVVDGTSSGGSDVDYYRLDVPAGGYSLMLDVRGGESLPCPVGADPTITLENAAGVALASNDDTLASLCPRLDGVTTTDRTVGTRDLAAGTYYVRLGAFGSPTAYSYRLVARLVRTASFETSANNDAPGGAQVLPGPRVSLGGRISDAGDVDHYAITPSTATLTIDVGAGQINGGGQCGPSTTDLMDPIVTLIRQSDLLPVGNNDDIDFPTNLCSRIVVGGLTPGATYLVKVARFSRMEAFDYVLTVRP